MNYIAMLALLKALTQEVNLLEIELAQLQASSSVAVATTTPIVFPTPIYQWASSSQNTNQNTNSDISLGSAPTTDCSLVANDVGDSAAPQTYMTWTLDGLPTSTIGNISAIEINVNPWNYNPSTQQFNPLSTSTNSWNIQNSPVGAFPNQNITLTKGWFQSITADFDGTTCTVQPTLEQ